MSDHNGRKAGPGFRRSFLEKETFDKIIAVDGGLKAVKELGLVPDYIVGDFDSVSNEIREEFRQYPFIVWEQHKPEKNETDTELARNRALTLSCDEIVFLGATGGRIDHMIGQHPCTENLYRAGNCRLYRGCAESSEPAGWCPYLFQGDAVGKICFFCSLHGRGDRNYTDRI